MNKNILKVTTILCSLVVFNNSASANTRINASETKSYKGEHVQTTTTVNEQQDGHKNSFGQTVYSAPYVTSSTTGNITNSEGKTIATVDGSTTGNGQGTGTTTVTATNVATGKSKTYSGTATKNDDGSYTETGSKGKSLTKNTDGSFTVKGDEGSYNITKVE